ncbi:hypothetical protein, partial [Alicyclobacillus suci]|uniref:hypothetical protein n=1 Tax=Alicyclobacillus suci TaxID=2816080 RepID=UPI001A8EA9DC
NPDADGYIERFFRSLKEEEVWMQEYDNFAEAKIAINQKPVCPVSIQCLKSVYYQSGIFSTCK